MMEDALKKFTQANNGLLPDSVSDLRPYFDPPVDDAVLQRYEMLYAGKLNDVPSGENLVAEKAPVDDEYDTLHEISTNGYCVSDASFSRYKSIAELHELRDRNALKQSMIDYAAANNGQEPTDLSQLSPYVKTRQSRLRCKGFFRWLSRTLRRKEAPP